MFTQLIDPLGNLTLTCLVALVPVVSLLLMLAVWRLPAWLATLLGSVLTFLLALWIWKMPFHDGVHAYAFGAATGVWNVDWITFWGMVLFNTLAVSGVFENFRRWLIAQAAWMCACRPCCSPGPSAHSSKAWSASATPGPSWR